MRIKLDVHKHCILHLYDKREFGGLTLFAVEQVDVRRYGKLPSCYVFQQRRLAHSKAQIVLSVTITIKKPSESRLSRKRVNEFFFSRHEMLNMRTFSRAYSIGSDSAK